MEQQKPDIDFLVTFVQKKLDKNPTYNVKDQVENGIEQAAKNELATEIFQEAVAYHKAKILERQGHWFPWKVSIRIIKR